MGPNTEPIIEPQNSTGIQSTPPMPFEPPKKSNKLSWFFGILSVLALTAAVTFAILYFTKPAAEQPVEPSQSSEPETPEPTEDGEVEITDALLKQNLDEKITILHDTDQPSSDLEIIKIGIGYAYSLPLYKEGTLSDVAKLSHVIRKITPDKDLSQDEMKAAIAEQGYTGNDAKAFEQYHSQGYKVETVSAKYLDVFGVEPKKGATNDQYYCPHYFYNSTYDFYYEATLGCGGTGPYYGHYYKNKYTTKDNHAYVYISAGTFNAEDDKAYCDVLDDPSETNSTKVCGEYSGPNEFHIDENNYQNFAEYRFVFTQADDGTYYFEKVEKL